MYLVRSKIQFKAMHTQLVLQRNLVRVLHFGCIYTV